MGKKIKRESFFVTKDEIDDFTSQGPWVINGEKYTFIEDFPSRDCDGVCHNVVVKRKSDSKLFRFIWSYNDGNYRYEHEWEEVFAETKTVYK